LVTATAAWNTAQANANTAYQNAYQAAIATWSTAEANARSAYDSASSAALAAWQSTEASARATYQSAIDSATATWNAAEQAAWAACQADIDSASATWEAAEAAAYTAMETAIATAVAAWNATEAAAQATLDAALLAALAVAEAAEATAFAAMQSAIPLAEVDAELAEAVARAALQSAFSGSSGSTFSAAAWGASGSGSSSTGPTPWDAFWGSLGDSYESIYTFYAGVMLDARNAFTDEDVPTQELYQRAYDRGPLGQTRDAEADPVGYYGTRGALAAATTATVIIIGRGGVAIVRGEEMLLSHGSRIRIAPFGNRTGHPTGRWPHYHRNVPDPVNPGNSIPGQGIGRHRPWDVKPPDGSFWDRF
jgi:hypothetical protein